MTEDGMRAAVVAHLVQPGTPPEGGERVRRGWSSSIRHEGGSGAESATIEFVKTKVYSTCQLHEVDYVNHRGWTMHALIETRQDQNGTWMVRPLGGGAGPAPRRSHSWVNLCAGIGPESFTAGGHVEGDGAEHAASVRLSFADGGEIEDTVDNGVVLFFEPRAIVAPVDVSVFDRDGAVLATYQEFTGLAP